jgi:hypothetical protein
MRVFAAESTGWAGGCASVVPRDGYEVRGLLSYLTDEELGLIDVFEAANVVYRQVSGLVHLPERDDGKAVHCVFYMKIDVSRFLMPSDAYCTAIYRCVRSGFPDHPDIAICDATGTEHSSWTPKRFAEMDLRCFLTELGLRVKVPWKLPGNVMKHMDTLAQRRVDSVRALIEAIGAEEPGGESEMLGLEERCIAQHLYAATDYFL